ncbi:MAG: flavin reductase family protein [Burkholderiaceae bacterium]
MVILIDESGPPRLDAPADFKRFSVRMAAGLSADAAQVLHGIGRLDDDGFVWVRPDALRAMLPARLPAGWEQGFAGMVAFADAHGWLAADGAIRAHIEFTEAREPIAPGAFRAALRQFAAGVCVVASGAGDARRGMTVSAFSSVSAEPPMILVCINAASFSHDDLVDADVFSVNILADVQRDIACTFAGMTGVHGAARFAHGDWRELDGAPALADALVCLVCEPAARHRAGSHTVMIGRVIAAVGADAGAIPLINYDGVMCSIGTQWPRAA